MRAPVVRSRVATLALVATLTSACLATSADHQLLDRFFAASRLRDRTAAARVATVIFEPNRDGIVVQFSVRSAEPLDRNRRALTVDAVVRRPDGTESAQVLLITVSRRTALSLPYPTSEWVVTAVTSRQP